MLEYDGGVTGVYWTSKVASGYSNALKVRVFGSKGSLEFSQEDCDNLKISMFGKPVIVLNRGNDPLYPHAQSYCRLPGGHPEGLHEAFANIYRTYIRALQKQKEGMALNGEDFDFPDAQAGLDGVHFIGKCVESSEKGAVWVSY